MTFEDPISPISHWTRKIFTNRRLAELRSLSESARSSQEDGAASFGD